MTAAQIKARANFKKAIAYRIKTGCSLKEAFAHVKGNKVTGLDKVVKKGNKTTVKYTKKAKKKAAPKKKITQGVLFGVKKKAAKKKAAPKKKNISTHKDTKSHNVNIRVMSGVNQLNNIKKDIQKKLENAINLASTYKSNIEFEKLMSIKDKERKIYWKLREKESIKKLAIAKKVILKLKKAI
jgi:hypothetical protein